MVTQIMKLCNSWRRKLLSLMGILATLILFSHFWVFSKTYFSTLFHGVEHDPLVITIRDTLHSKNPLVNNNSSSSSSSYDLLRTKDNVGDLELEGNENILTRDHVDNEDDVDPVKGLSSKRKLGLDVEVLSNFSIVEGDLGYKLNNVALGNGSSMTRVEQVAGEYSLRNESIKIERCVRRMRGVTIALSDMKAMLIKGSGSSTSMRHRRLTARDRQLVSVRLQIENAPILRNVMDLHASIFRNVSMFKRSYDLMERIVKIYVYKEGEKPIFHQPLLRGLYSAEGWFMKLMERSKNFTVRDPRKAHLFYLPFSSNTLRTALYEKSRSVENLGRYLSNYVDLIKRKYSFWNRTGGADHFFVACHDWAPRITRQHLSSCIRALCNANAARGFSIGKDVSIPVTYVRSGNDPLRDIGGKPPSERDILAFFAGQIHGYLRPLLLQYWENKTPDMKIFGPMQRDIEGKAVYREFMKSSKYCICARGYEVHTPRVVESIFYECVPVIISDNYVPPFFEVLDWEAFAVFVQEKDIPNLRNILLSIPEGRYLDMQLRVKLVQRHFLWHKIPEKYDLFHMILHSVWYTRVLHIGQ